jgi:CRISPR-associated protein Cas2
LKEGEDLLVLITYDVNTETPAGRRRLRKVAKECLNYGQRVQNSVFECVVDAAQSREIKEKLIGLIDEETDSLRFYYLGNNYKGKVEHVGAKETYDVDAPIIL